MSDEDTLGNGRVLFVSGNILLFKKPAIQVDRRRGRKKQSVLTLFLP